MTNREEYIQMLKPIVSSYLDCLGFYRLYWAYSDELSAKTILRIYHNLKQNREEYKNGTFLNALENYLYALNSDADFEFMDSIKRDVCKSGNEKLISFYNEFDLDYDILEETGYNGVDVNLEDLLDNTELHLNVMFATKQEQNYNMSSIVTAFGSWKEPCPRDKTDFDNALTYLIHQQGHTVQEVYDCLFANPRGFSFDYQTNFVESVADDIVNNTSEACSELCVLIKLSGQDILTFFDMILKNDYYIKFGTDVELGVFNEWSGCGGTLDINLEKDFVVPVNMIRNIQIEGAGKENNGYTVNSVYGLVGTCWKDSFCFADEAPELTSEDYLKVLEDLNVHLESVKPEIV